jgi:hypothetical protein
MHMCTVATKMSCIPMMCELCRLRVCVVDNGEKREREVDNDMIMCFHCSLVVGFNTLPECRRPDFLDCSYCTYVLFAGVASIHSIHPKLISVFLTHGNPGTLLEVFYELGCNVVCMSCHGIHACHIACVGTICSHDQSGPYVMQSTCATCL